MFKKNLIRIMVVVLVLMPTSWLFPVHSLAQDILLSGNQFSTQYLIQLSGTVMNETFSGAQALLTMMAPPPPGSNMPPSPGSDNPYQLIIQGFPKKNSRNSFFWNSNHSEMRVFANEITCEIKRAFVKPVPMHFIFLSPELLKHTGALATRSGDEGKKLATGTALPTLITARAGKLQVRIYSDSILGTIWMKGYDPVESAFVLYSANIYGQRSFKLQPKQELKKATTVGSE